MQEILRLIVMIILGGLLVLTILAQLKIEVIDRFCQQYMLGIIPKWTFFAPKPGVTDFRISYRCFTGVNESTGLVPVFEEFFHRPFYAFIWNPNKRLKKAVFDMSVELATMLEQNHHKNNNYYIEISLPYLLILSYVSSLPQVQLYSKVQFVISLSSYHAGEEKLQLMYTSNIHSLNDV